MFREAHAQHAGELRETGGALRAAPSFCWRLFEVSTIT
jgi:hypothetical protein